MLPDQGDLATRDGGYGKMDRRWHGALPGELGWVKAADGAEQREAPKLGHLPCILSWPIARLMAEAQPSLGPAQSAKPRDSSKAAARRCSGPDSGRYPMRAGRRSVAGEPSLTRMQALRTERLWRWWPVALLCLMAIPRGTGGVFDGLPFSGWPEFIAFLAILPACSGRVQRLLSRRLATIHRSGPRFASLLALCGIAVSSALVYLGTPAGFYACYTSALPGQSPACERSYENATSMGGATRFDRTILFDPNDWRLSFFNDNRFNFYGWVAGERVRSRLPFNGEWRGWADVPVGSAIAIEYTGTGTLQIDGRSTDLPPAYATAQRVTIEVPPGARALSLAYTFDDGSRVGSLREGPGATLRLVTVPVAHSGVSAPLVAAPASHWQLGAQLAVDGTIAALAVALAALLLGSCRRHWLPIALALTAVLSISLAVVPGGELWLLTLVNSALAAWLMLARRRRVSGLLAVYLCNAGLLCATLASLGMMDNPMWLRDGGSDWLTYESLARSFLESGSLRGGEDVFYYQPLSRYIRFLLHALLGDGDAFLTGLELLALNMALLWLCWLVAPRRSHAAELLLAWVGAACALSIINSRTLVFEIVAQGASETWTWIFLPLAIGLLFHPALERNRYRSAGVLLAGLSVITRFNHAPALTLMMAVFIGAQRRRAIRQLLVWAGLFLGVTLLPLAHNLYFGGTAVLTTASATIPENLANDPLSPAGVQNVASRTRDQLNGILYLGRFRGPLTQSFLGLQLIFVVALGAAAARAPIRWRHLLIGMVPVAYLAVHIVYQVAVYYPRHIVAGYLAIACFAILTAIRIEVPCRRAGSPA